MSTPHNSAKKGDFAKTVLMPGDPLRAKFIAENFLTDAVLVNNVRGVQGYTVLQRQARIGNGERNGYAEHINVRVRTFYGVRRRRHHQSR